MKKIILVLVATMILAAAYVSVASALTVYKGQSGYIFQWYSTDPSRVLVDKNGKITPIGYGSADVCAQLKSDLSVKLCTTVVVK